MKYILDDNNNSVVEPDLIKWATWMKKTNRQIKDDKIGDVRVSTVFLGIDHSFSLGETPILYETMVFGGDLDGYQERYSSRDDALVGHNKVRNLVCQRQKCKS